MMTDTEELQDLLDEHGIRHFSVFVDHRILSPVERGGRGIVVPPRELWPHIIPTLRLADLIRASLGMPVTVTSGYRTPKYDRARGRTGDSQHHHFRALDLKVPDEHYAQLRAVSRAVMDAASLGGMPTGWGNYDDPRDMFVHIDTWAEKDNPKRRWKG